VRHLLAAYELGEDNLFGHIKPRKTRSRFLDFCRYLRSVYPPDVRIAIVGYAGSSPSKRSLRRHYAASLTVPHQNLRKSTDLGIHSP